MSLSQKFANEHVKKWIDCWNNRDLETILSMYSDNIEFSSPKIKIVFPDRNTSKINNKKDLERYWSLALKKNYPNLKFTAKEVFVINNYIILEYFANLNDTKSVSVIEKFEFKDGLILKSSVFYGADDLSL